LVIDTSTTQKAGKQTVLTGMNFSKGLAKG
jgi:hypothetical protein